MSEFSDFAEDLILDWMFTTGAATRPTAWWIGLSTTAISDAETGTTFGTEVSGNGYARQQCVFNAASGGSLTLNGAEAFTAAGGNWGTITEAAILSAATTGDMYCFSPLDTSRTINDGETLNFADQSITISLD